MREDESTNLKKKLLCVQKSREENTIKVFRQKRLLCTFYSLNKRRLMLNTKCEKNKAIKSSLGKHSRMDFYYTAQM